MLEGVNLSGDRGNKLSEALTEYRTMVADLLADDPEAQVQVGIDALQRGDDRAGEMAFRQALKVWPGMPDAYAGLGTVFIRNKQFSEAVKMWGKQRQGIRPWLHLCITPASCGRQIFGMGSERDPAQPGIIPTWGIHIRFGIL